VFGLAIASLEQSDAVNVDSFWKSFSHRSRLEPPVPPRVIDDADISTGAPWIA
jgi:hypothetical protein